MDDLISVHIGGDVIRGHCPLSPLAAAVGRDRERERERERGYFRKSLIIRLRMIRMRNEPAKIIYSE